MRVTGIGNRGLDDEADGEVREVRGIEWVLYINATAGLLSQIRPSIFSSTCVFTCCFFEFCSGGKF